VFKKKDHTWGGGGKDKKKGTKKNNESYERDIYIKKKGLILGGGVNDHIMWTKKMHICENEFNLSRCLLHARTRGFMLRTRSVPSTGTI